MRSHAAEVRARSRSARRSVSRRRGSRVGEVNRRGVAFRMSTGDRADGLLDVGPYPRIGCCLSIPGLGALACLRLAEPAPRALSRACWACSRERSRMDAVSTSIHGGGVVAIGGSDGWRMIPDEYGRYLVHGGVVSSRNSGRSSRGRRCRRFARRLVRAELLDGLDERSVTCPSRDRMKFRAVNTPARRQPVARRRGEQTAPRSVPRCSKRSLR